MKITKKQPLRPRGRSEEKRQSTKNAIRDAYINGPQKEVQIIPAKRDMEAETEKKKLRVCAYCRVSTDEDTQASSYELQVQNYTRMIQENPEWEFAGIFADEGISGTSVLHREHFLEMIEKCLRYCYDHGFDWDGLYEIFRRVSCWCCPLQSLSELRKLYRHFPELWEQLKTWDGMTWRKFRADYSVEELEKRFDFEEEWQNAGKPLKSKAFYSALKDRLRGENT